MTCRELIDFLMAYLDGDLPEKQRDEFEKHLEECSACVVYMETYRATSRLGKRACSEDDGALPEEIPEELVRAILAARRRPSDAR